MKPLPAWFRALVRVLGTLIPPVMTRIAYRLFWDLGQPMAVKPQALDVHRRARREIVAIGDRQAVVYRWGTGPETVLLVHGWRGRASQFATLVEALESPARTIVAFDAPGNGDSPGNRTDLRDYLALIRLVARESGGLDLLVGHSFGVLGAFVAVHEGVRAKRLVSIAGVSSIGYTFDTFARVGQPPADRERGLRRRIERNVFDGDTKFWTRFVSELDPVDRTPLLVIHDVADRQVEFDQCAVIAEAHVGAVTELHTTGLGHVRVLSDREVVQAIIAFAKCEIPVS
jgi:pimeloyl-ACP methyl ester carboxylesterase